MPDIIYLVDSAIDVESQRLFTLYDIDNVTALAAIDWWGGDVYSPCITIMRDGVNINYDGVIIAAQVTSTNGSLSIAPAPAWYSRQGTMPPAKWKNRKEGEKFFFATCDNPTGDSSYCQKYRNLCGDNYSLRLNNLNVWNDATMTGSCMDMRIGINYSSTGKRVLIAQASIDTVNPFATPSTCTPRNENCAPMYPPTHPDGSVYVGKCGSDEVWITPCTSFQ